MNEKIYSLSKSINEELNNKEEVKLLNKLEKELNDSYEVYVLSNKKDEALEKYISNKDLYGDDSDITKESLKELKTAKENLTVKRIAKKPTYTIGKLYIDGVYFCDTVEDTDRGLFQG